MSSSIGIYASQISGHLVTNNYSSIQTVTVGSGGASSITFSSIPSTWTHLQLRYMAQATGSGSYTPYLQMGNGSIDTSNNYSFHFINGNGSSVTAVGQSSSGNNVIITSVISNNSNTNIFGVGIIDILDYANVNKTKVIRNLGGADSNGSGNVGLFSGAWFSTSAINTLTLFNGGANWAQNTTFALYGVR